VARTTNSVVVDRRIALHGYEDIYKDEYHACLRHVGHWVFLGPTSFYEFESGSWLFGFQLGRPYVTFMYEAENRYRHEDTKVEQYNLRTARRDFAVNYEAEPFVHRLDPDANRSPPELVSDASGNAAWVFFTPGENLGRPTTESLVVHDSAGTRTVAVYLVSTVTPREEIIEITALHIGDHSVRWKHLGQLQSTPLV
jgi:hypothetical protein